MSEATADLSSEDLYTRLGVTPGASPDEIKRAYLGLVRVHTPERSPESFKRIREAYETLSNPASRAQYDARPDPQIKALLDQASAAMKANNYTAAEQAYKQVLIESPDLQYVRNLLGLCFLYQEEPDKAIAQYERLIGSPSADASMHGNAAHAYRMAKRYDEAEREFRAAMQLAGDQSMEYGLSLVQMVLEQGDARRADEIAVTEAATAPPGSTAAVEYICKRIEIALPLKQQQRIPGLLSVLGKSVTTDEQRRYGAFALGKLAIRLIRRWAFELAETVAKAAKALQPADPDYDGLEQAGRLLYRNDFEGVTRLLNTHVSFTPKGWLNGLRQPIEHYCSTHKAFQGMRPIKSPPSMFRVNGCGTALMGKRAEDSQTNTYIATLYATFVFLPVFPIACYRVQKAPTRGWYFIGKVGFDNARKIHLAAFVALFVVWAIAAIAR